MSMTTPAQPFIEETCEQCSYGRMMETDSEWWVKCDDCGAMKFCYVPLPHQSRFHADTHKYRLFAGGYGSGKTTTTVAEVIRHVLDTPRGTTLMGAATLPQLEQTSMKQFFEMMPKEFITNRSIQKNYVDIINGHRVLFRPLDSEGKARSLNLTCFHIEEASEVNFDYFVQLQTRLRNHATKHHIGLISTNPDNSWVRNEFLIKSANIVNSPTKYHQEEWEINPNFSSHIAPTNLNTHLPPTFYEDTARGKPHHWIRKYLDGSFEFAEGAVYPMFPDHVIEPFDILTKIKEQGWEVYAGSDFGLRDATVMLMVAVDHINGVAYVYDEHYESNKDVKYHAKKMLGMMDQIPTGLLRQPVGDPAGKRKTANERRSLFDHYAEYGIYFKPGFNRIEDGIMKVFTYLSLGKLKVFSSCKNTVREMINYKYKEQSLDATTNADEKPIDKDNHTCDTLRYIVQELPDDPDYLRNPSYSQYDLRKSDAGKVLSDYLPPQLQEDDEYGSDDWQVYY